MISANQSRLPPNLWLVLLPLLIAVFVLLFGYQNTMSEPDLVRMMAGMVYGGVTGGQVFADYHYGIEFSFGFYQILYHLLPETALRDPDQVARAMNHMGQVMAVLFALGLCLMLEKLTDRIIALFCAIIFLFSPLGMPFLSSGHPMVGACAFLFLGGWLLLRSHAYSTLPTLPALPLRLFHLALAMLLLLVSLTLRAEIGLAFPFVGLAWLVTSPLPWKQRIPQGLLPLAVMLLAVGAFLYFQRPFVVGSGGAMKSIGGYIADFSSNQRITQGLGVMTLAFGSISALGLAWVFVLQFKPRPAPAQATQARTVLLIPIVALIVPSLLFWISIPQPARHFIIPVLGLSLLLGVLAASRLRNQTRALVLGIVLVVANQVVAEWVLRPLILKHYQWSYYSDNVRRTSQRMPLGLFPLDQQGNLAEEAVLKQEALQMARQAPNKLLILGDHKFYMIAHLLAADPDLRLGKARVGNFEALLLSHKSNSNGRVIYLVEKYTFWPKDVLSEILAVPEFSDYPVYVQKKTISNYDKTQVPAERKFALD